jgi:1-acyl-sn-glycerol-3-phosphate acyltransferase
MNFAEQLKKAVVPGDVDSLDSFDPELVGLVAPMIRRVLGGYFRAEIRGIEHIPRGAAMIVGNHNAGITFLEPFLFGTEFYAQRGMDERLYFLGHDAVVRMPGLGRVLGWAGTIRASHRNGRRILDAGHKIVVFPGGNHEAFRPWSQRNVVDFGGHRGFAALALERDAPIVPMANVGGHETLVILRRGERLGRLLGTDRLLRSKAFPIALAAPWGLAVGPVFHLPLPARSTVEVGEPIVPSQAVGALPAEKRVDALYELVVARVQTMVDRAAAGRRFPVLG